MTEADRDRWDRRYAEGAYTPRDHASPWLERWLPSVPVGAALDLACGTGRNARYLAANGFDVTAVDVSPTAIEQARAATPDHIDVRWEVADLDDLDLTAASLGGPFSLVSVVRFRDETLWPRIAAALAPDGWVLVEHHLRTTLEDVGGPTDEAFRLAPGELLAGFDGLRVVAYEEAVEASDHPALPGQTFVNARLAAVRGTPGW